MPLQQFLARGPGPHRNRRVWHSQCIESGTPHHARADLHCSSVVPGNFDSRHLRTIAAAGFVSAIGSGRLRVGQPGPDSPLPHSRRSY